MREKKLSILKVSIRQIKAARSLLAWSQEKLAEASGVSTPTIKRLESEDGDLGGRAGTGDKIITALESAGVEFTNGGQPGVRFKAAPPKPAISDQAAIGDDPETRGDPYTGSAK
jgi:transcriptional regulator with XRE-family HTH domain